MTQTDSAAVRAVAAPERAFGVDDAGVDGLEANDYVQEEFLLSGFAYRGAFTTRLLVRRPRDPALVSGIAVVEPMHFDGGRPVWSTIHRQLMRAGHVCMEIACQRPPVERMVAVAPDRYTDVELTAGDPDQSPVSPGVDPRADRDTFIASWWWSSPQLVPVCGQGLAALRSGKVTRPAPRRIVLAGISQTGGIVRRIARALAEEELSRQEAPDGLLACNSGGAEPMAGPVPSIELLAEADLESVRAAAGLPGQGRGLLHRQPDSDTFRLFEVAGMAHMDSRRTTREPPPEREWSRFPHAEVMAATLEQLVSWIDHGVPPGPGVTLALQDGSEQLLRDDYGHAVGGVRTVATDVPRAILEPLGDGGRAFPLGCEFPMTEAEICERYGSPESWRLQARQRAAELVAERWLRPEDGDSWR